MPRPPRRKASHEAGEQSTPPRPLQAQHEARGVIRTLYPVPRRRAAPKQKKEARGGARRPGLRVPDLFDVITYFRARGDSYALIANIGFWMGEDRTKVLTAKGLKLWYEGELDRRAAVKANLSS